MLEAGGCRARLNAASCPHTECKIIFHISSCSTVAVAKNPEKKFNIRDITVESYEKDGDEHVERSNSLLERLFAVPK
jgi:hypothetical protein